MIHLDKCQSDKASVLISVQSPRVVVLDFWGLNNETTKWDWVHGELHVSLGLTWERLVFYFFVLFFVFICFLKLLSAFHIKKELHHKPLWKKGTSLHFHPSKLKQVSSLALF